ncbi:LIM domain-containing protein 2-like isoform X2 [Lytechinus variegatus]|uniref:LIM domain-containing protein 2-like isoform X2 n=2 Tax=Lytechinus TaxID=7652 RepID=UPI001BB2C859|nr:LIM domain-containing protein 2-like isoform X2 [Lytechinus variegatus]XP_041466909.1 LIM domain-containing protein 2-like isoform X2 [Lytechinus variegatus]
MTTMQPIIRENEGYRSGLTRSKSNRLDSSKFSKFESSPNSSTSSESSSGSKRHTFTGTGRLNMSRFSQFEKGSDSSDGGSQPIKRNAGTRSRSLKFGSGGSTVTSEMCIVCNRRVYPMEKITADNVIYHKTCFRCAECKACLSLGKYAALNGNVFCKPHFKQMFKLKGNYNFSNQATSPRQATNGVSTDE